MLQTCWQAFRLENLKITVSVVLLTRWQASIRSGEISQPSFANIFKTFSFRTSPETSWGMPTISRHSRLEYWAFNQRCLSKVVNLVNNKLLTVFVTASFERSCDTIPLSLLPPPELYYLYLPICFIGSEELVWDLVYVVYLVSRQYMLLYFSY